MIETPEHPLAPWLEKKLKEGAHRPTSADRPACVLEAAAQARLGLTPTTADLKRWTDDPDKAGLPDIRRLNDTYLSDERRTEAMGRLATAYWGWPEMSEARRREVMARVAELTIRRVLPIALRAVGLEAEAVRCEADGDVASAKAAAGAAWAAEAADAAEAAAWAAAQAASADAAWAAARTAALAARAAADACAAGAVAKDDVLDGAVVCWLEALREPQKEGTE